MESHHGKNIDPRKLKQDDIQDLESKVEESREQACEYKSRTDLQIDECPVCQSAERETVLEMFGIVWKQCDSCSHVYQPEILSQKALTDFYESDEQYASTYTDEEQIEYRLEHVTKPKFDFLLDNIDTEPGRWLDVGCGNGGSVYYLDSLGWDATGLEISEHSVRTAADLFGVELQQQTLQEYSQNNPEAEFDAISMFGYLDLIEDPLADLQIASDMLSDGGYLAVHIPKYDSVSLRVQQTFPDQAVRVLGWNVLHFYTEESLKTLLRQTGFEAKTAWYYGLDFYELLMHLSLSIDGFVDSELYSYFMQYLNEFQQVIDTSEMSDYFTVIAKKCE